MQALSSANLVGLAKQEQTLTTAAAAGASKILQPGRGRRLIVLEEVELGTGRPDLLLVTCAPTRLDVRRQSGLRITNLTEARVLAHLLALPEDAQTVTPPGGITSGHYRHLRNRLSNRSWLTPSGRGEAVRPAAFESLLIEAKVANWRGGLLQLLRNQRAASSIALLVPTSVNYKVDRALLQRYGVGLLLFDPSKGVTWQRRSRQRALTRARELWLAELAIRHLESGRTYDGASRASNSARAAR